MGRVGESGSDVPPWMDRRYFADLGNERERIAVRRWMFTRIGDLTNALGLRGGWWLGLFLERSDLFGDGADGDVDFIGGPIEYDFTEEEWADRVWFERRTQPAAPSLPDWCEQQAHIRAAREGRLQWPPSLRFTVGGEFKASHYTDRWKATHVAEGNRVLGQLSYVKDAGVNRVAFVHLAATSPVAGVGAEPIYAAKRQLDAARPTFPRVFDPKEHPDFGYFQVLLGALPDGTEESAALGGELVQVSGAPLVNPGIEQAWHAGVRERLSRLEPPNFRRTWVLHCDGCEAWRHAGHLAWAWSPCACGRAPVL